MAASDSWPVHSEPDPPGVGYLELPTDLPDVFRCVWQRRGSVPQGARSTVLPDACADIIVDQSGAAVLVGPTMIPHRLGLTRSVTLHGLRLQPWAVPLLFRMTAGDLRDQVLPLDDLLGSRAARDAADSVWHGAVPRHWRTVDTTPWQLRLVKDLFDASSGDIERAGRNLGVSNRHARRTIRDLTGFSPRELAHVGRLHRVLPLIDRGDLPLAVAAIEAGYTDQAHMTRDLRRLAGVTPKSLRRERAGADLWTGERVLRTASDLITGT